MQYTTRQIQINNSIMIIMMMDDKNDDDRDDDDDDGDDDNTFIKRSFPSQEFKLPMHDSD